MLFCLEFLHRAADLTLVPSAAIGKDLEAERVTSGKHFLFSFFSHFSF